MRSKEAFNNLIELEKDHEDILNFINEIKKFDTVGDIKKLFTEGYCYGFALMLKQYNKSGSIHWDKYNSHAVYKLNDRYYDITGEYLIRNKDLLLEVDVDIIEGRDIYKNY